VATAVASLGLLALGSLGVWAAWRSSQGDERARRVATPTGLAGGVVVLAGVAVGVSGVDTPPGVIALVAGAVAMVGGAVAWVSAAARA
jgi:hypothetical protein